jgi:acyl-CoA reductase-like NAD-dependent aldehyde dehydrogenase
VCESGARLFVHRAIFDEFIALKERFEEIKVGDPLDLNTQMGRQFSQQQMERILGYIDLATLKGARIITAGATGCCESDP